MKVTRLERQKIEERLGIIFQLIEFFGEEVDDEVPNYIHAGEYDDTGNSGCYRFLRVRMEYK